MTETSTEACSTHFADVYLGTKSASTESHSHTVPALRMSAWEPNQLPQRHAAPTSWMSTWEPEREQENEVRQPELEALTKRQLKRR